MISAYDVAVVMPLGRLSPWFEEAFKSVLNQDIEVPVHFIANRLTDEENLVLSQICRNQPSATTHEFSERLNMVSNWNRMIQSISSKYLAILHDDDLLEPWAISSLIHAANEFPDRGIYFTRERIIDGEGNFVDPCPEIRNGTARALSQDEIFGWAISNKICATGFLIDLDKAKSINGFNEEIHYSPDWDLYFRLGASFGACFVDIHGGRYRLGSTTGQLSSEFARQGGSVTAYRAQQLLNLSFIGVPPETCKKQLDIGLSNQAKTVLNYFGSCLDNVGKSKVREAIRGGLWAKYLFGASCLSEFGPVKFMLNKLIDWKYPVLQCR